MTDPEEAGWEPGMSQSEAEEASSSSLRASGDKRSSGNRLMRAETFISLNQPNTHLCHLRQVLFSSPPEDLFSVAKGRKRLCLDLYKV